MVDRAAGELLVVLRLAVLGRARIGQRGREAAPGHRLLRHAVQDRGHLGPGDVEDRRRDVDGVNVLRAHGAPIRGRGPAHDQRIADPALVGLPLPAPERRVPRQRPAPGIVAVRLRASQLAEHGARRFHVVRQAVEDEVLVEGAVRAALRAGAVVAEREDQRAVELAAAGEEVEQAAEVVIGVRQEAGIDLHHAGVCAPLLGRKRRPVLHPRRPSRQRRPRRDDSGRDLPRQRSLAPHVPPLVEPPAIALDPLAGRLVRRVARAQRQIEEERLVGVRRADVDHALDGVVHQVLGQMVAVGRREPERRVVGHQIGRELVGLAAEKAVVALEALAEGPAIAGGGGVLLVGGCQVPFPDCERRPSRLAQHLGDEAAGLRDAAVVPGEPHAQVGDAAHGAGVVVAAREQAGPGRRAHRGGVEVAVAQAVRGEAVEPGRVDVGAEAPELREADVVEHHQHHVGGTAWGAGRDRPRRDRFGEGGGDPARKGLPVAVHERLRHAGRLARDDRRFRSSGPRGP